MTPDIEINNHEDGAAIMRRAGGSAYNPKASVVIARKRNGRLLGGAVFDHWNRYSLEMHSAGFVPNWLSRDLLWVCFDYPFRQLGIERVFVQMSATNTKSLHFTDRLGFKQVAEVPHVFGEGESLVVKSMCRKDCQWLTVQPRVVQQRGQTNG